MTLLSKPLFRLVKSGGQIIWKEERAARFPKLRKLPRIGKFTFVMLMIVMPCIVYFKAQVDCNSDSWYASKYIFKWWG